MTERQTQGIRTINVVQMAFRNIHQEDPIDWYHY